MLANIGKKGEAASADIRQIRRINLREGPTGNGDPKGPYKIAAVVDVETTGLNQLNDKVIELAIRRFKYDGKGRVLEIGRIWSWREDPGFPLPDEIVHLTGITDDDLVGQIIDDHAAINILASADLVIAHHAQFDRPMVENRLTDLPQLSWACSCDEIDWRKAGFDGRALGWLCMQAGWFFEAHNASSDVDALVQLLQHEDDQGSPLMAELAKSAISDSYLIEAIGAGFASKDALKARGYRWNPDKRVWWREVFDREYIIEQDWLAHQIYGTKMSSIAAGPRITRRTAFDRYRIERAAHRCN